MVEAGDMPHCTFLHLSSTGVPGDRADRFSQAFLLLALPQGNIHFLLLLPSEDTSKTLQQGSRSLPSPRLCPVSAWSCSRLQTRDCPT